MAHIVADRVRETSTTTGTGVFTLAGAVSGYRTFAAVCVNADTIWYSISHRTSSEWEVGIGTSNGSTSLTRTTVLASSNAGAAVNFTSGTKDVFGVEPAGKMPFGKQAIWIPASAMTPRTTAGATAFSAETTTNDVMIVGLAFNTSTDSHAEFYFVLPKQWNGGTVSFRAYWTARSGSGTVQFELSARSFANDAAMDQSLVGSPVAVDDTLTAADDVDISPESTAITITGAAADTLTIFNVMRDVSDDTLGVDAILLGIELYITTNSANDI